MRIGDWSKGAHCDCGKVYQARVARGQAFFGGKDWVCPKCARDWTELTVKVARFIKPFMKVGYWEEE